MKKKAECGGLFSGFERENDRIAVAAVGIWKSHLIAISKGRGKGVKTCFRFSSLSTARHFHGRPRRPNVLAPLSAGMRSRRFYPRATAKNRVLSSPPKKRFNPN